MFRQWEVKHLIIMPKGLAPNRLRFLKPLWGSW